MSSLVPSQTMGSFSVFMTMMLGVKFIVKPVMTTKEAMQAVDARTRTNQSVLCGAMIGFICGFIGAGGGMMMLLILTSVLGYELKTAVGTSVLIMTFTALTGALSHFSFGSLPDLTIMLLCQCFAAGAASPAQASEILFDAEDFEVLCSAQDENGNLCIGGRTKMPKGRLICVDTTGNLLWSVENDLPGGDWYSSIVPCGDGRYMALHQQNDSTFTHHLEMIEQGQVVKTTHLPDEQAFSLYPAEDGVLLLTGTAPNTPDHQPEEGVQSLTLRDTVYQFTYPEDVTTLPFQAAPLRLTADGTTLEAAFTCDAADLQPGYYRLLLRADITGTQLSWPDVPWIKQWSTAITNDQIASWEQMADMLTDYSRQSDNVPHHFWHAWGEKSGSTYRETVRFDDVVFGGFPFQYGNNLFDRFLHRADFVVPVNLVKRKECLVFHQVNEFCVFFGC